MSEVADPPMKPPQADSRKMSAAWRAYGETLTEEQNLKNHMPLVRSVVDRMRASLPPTVDVEDLYSVGLMGLIHALRRFDPTLGVTFASYATMRIRGAVLDELRRLDWLSRSLRVKAKKVTEIIAGIEQREGRPATEAEVASELGVSSEEDDSNMHDVVPDEKQPSASDLAMKNELIKLVVDRLQQLPEMQRKILAMYYFENLRLAEIAKVFGVTESRICQIHTQAVLSLKNYIRTASNK
jgi:RNA polymerase sigma factor FliA